jgi:RNA polymerase sigma factor (sigma-70 family)
MRVVSNDEKLFHELFDNNYEELLTYANSITSDIDTASDMVQEVLKNFWIKRQDIFSKSNDIKRYLFGSVRNLCIDHVRKNAAHARIKKQLTFLVPVDPYEVNSSQLEADMTAVAVTVSLKRAIEKLSPRYQHFLKLHFYEGYRMCEIEKVLGLNQVAAANLKARSLKALRNNFNFNYSL